MPRSRRTDGVEKRLQLEAVLLQAGNVLRDLRHGAEREYEMVVPDLALVAADDPVADVLALEIDAGDLRHAEVGLGHLRPERDGDVPRFEGTDARLDEQGIVQRVVVAIEHHDLRTLRQSLHQLRRARRAPEPGPQHDHPFPFSREPHCRLEGIDADDVPALGLYCPTMLALLALAPVWNADLTPARRAALDSITAKALKADVAYLADDRLEGRATPSKGLDLAADYIAGAFKKAKLEPKGDDGFFQTTEYLGRDGTKGKVRNVVGLLKGSDPALRDEVVMVTAHYDHLGVRPDAPGVDKVYNGANDDASGTAGVMALASALGKAKPKRSVLFVAFWGEERGLLGSTYYGAHPVVPLLKTVADVNLEQIGRTDDTEGPRVNAVSVTGFDYSDVTVALLAAGRTLGMEVQKHPRYSDPFFLRSDNRALALAGVPAHTISVAFEFPGYHQPDDEASRLDYDNMTKVVRLAGLGILTLADAPQTPRWNAENPKTERYRKVRGEG